MKTLHISAVAMLIATACGRAAQPAEPEVSVVAAEAQAVEISDVDPAELPAEVRALAEGAASGFVISEVLKKVRDGRTYYDVEGALADGSELEFDILIGEIGPEIVEIQRDLNWANVPEAVRAAVPGVEPARVIESMQTDGMIIFELFAPGLPADPAVEVSLTPDGAVAVLQERWPH